MICSLHQLNSNRGIVLASVSFNVFTVYKKEELMGWYPSGVTRTRIIRVIGVIFSEFLIRRNRENEI